MIHIRHPGLKRFRKSCLSNRRSLQTDVLCSRTERIPLCGTSSAEPEISALTEPENFNPLYTKPTLKTAVRGIDGCNDEGLNLHLEGA